MKTITEITREIDQKFNSERKKQTIGHISVKTYSPSVDTDRPRQDIEQENAKIREFARQHRIHVSPKKRVHGGIGINVITDLCILPDEAAKILGKNSVLKLQESCRRQEVLKDFSLDKNNYGKFMRSVDEFTPEIFDYIITGAKWLLENDTSTMYRREVQAPFDSKFCEVYETQLTTLIGKENLPGKDHRSGDVIVFYRDPLYLEVSDHLCDIIIPGYCDTPFAYNPETIVICENKLSAMIFPPTHRTISIMGQGKSAASRLKTITRIIEHKQLIYWGDIDEAGFGILTNLRKKGITVRSLCMDLKTVQDNPDLNRHAERDSSAGVEITLLTEQERLAFSLIELGQLQRIEQESLSLDYVSNRLAEIVS